MPALYPVSVAAEDYQIGDNVRWFGSAAQLSPYVGKVVAISPKTYKVWVTWPIGDTKQHSPEELVLVPKYEGMSVVPGDNGFDSYDKQKSEKNFGTMSPSRREKSASILADQYTKMLDTHKKMASYEERYTKIASDFSIKLADSMLSKAVELKKSGMRETQAYEAMYKNFGKLAGDDLVKEATELVFK